MKDVTLQEHKKLVADIESLLMLNYGASMSALNMKVVTLPEQVQKEALKELRAATLKVYKLNNAEFVSLIRTNRLLQARATFSWIAWQYYAAPKKEIQRQFKRKDTGGSFGMIQTKNHNEFYLISKEYRENYAKILELINLKIPTKC